MQGIGWIAAIILGIVGAIIANAILGIFGIFAAGAWIPQLIVGIIGACILIWGYRAVKS